MLYFAFKTIISAVIIVSVAEIAKRSPLLAGLVASLPLVSVLAIVWLYVDTKSPEQVIELSRGILLMILPSLIFFIALPFTFALIASMLITAATYWLYTALLGRLGVTF